MTQKFITYIRVSTDRQGKSGLGLAAQRQAVMRHLGEGCGPLAEYQEIESGRNDERPELCRALNHCRRAGAVLVIAKLDRLARSARFLLELIDSGVEVRFCDLPQVAGASGRFLLTSMAAVAELEAGLISERTKAALAAAKARGVKLGAPNGRATLERHREAACSASAQSRALKAQERAEAWRESIHAMLGEGMSNSAIACALDQNGERSVSGGRWTATAVRRLRERLGLKEDEISTQLRKVGS